MPASPSHPRTALAVGCTAHAVQDGLTAATYVLLPILSQAFGFTYAQAGLVKGLKSLTQAVLEMYSGILAERIGEGRTLVFGLILSGLGYASLAAASHPSLVMACLLIVGAGTAFQHSPSSALVSTAYAEGGRRGALGLYNSSGDVGKLGFSAFFSLAAGAGLAWQQISIVFGLTAILAAAAVALATRRLRPRPTGGSDRRPERRQGDDVGWGVLSWRAFGTLLVVISIDNLVQAGVLVFIAFLMIAKGLPLYLATMATVALLTGGVFGKAGCGYLAEHLGVRPAFALVQLLTCLGLVAVVMAPAWLAFILLLPLGVVAQGSTSITYGLVADLIHPRRMARGYAIMYSLTSFAAAIGPWLFGLVGDRFGIETAMLVMAAAALLAVPPIALFPAVTPSARRPV
ncbi:MAG: MFS transporter [Alphaproteobacteria bacterium]